MAVIRIDALRRLERALVCAAPMLEGKVCVGQQAPGTTLAFPHLVIDPLRWRYVPDQADIVVELPGDRVVVNVGRHEATVQIRVGAATPAERADLEQRLLDAFLSTDLHPGVIITEITDCPALGSYVASWELEDDEWQDEKAFDLQFYSLINATGIIPALATRRGVYTITDLRLGVADYGTLTPPTPFQSTAAVEVVRVNEDGTFTKV